MAQDLLPQAARVRLRALQSKFNDRFEASKKSEALAGLDDVLRDEADDLIRAPHEETVPHVESEKLQPC
jgi:parvulin-like peptidyl-prolyl isomerase